MTAHKNIRYIGKGLKKAMRLRGGGSALPGLVVEKLDPQFLSRALGNLPEGVVVISGTNGKTTTTKMVTHLLRAEGLRVFTNPSGSNFTRGIVAGLIDKVDENGRLDADIAVIELDEAHAVHFIRQVKPRYSLILNVLRDQLDRFGEIDTTAKLLEKVVSSTTGGVVLNREDRLVRELAKSVKQDIKLAYFGLSEKLRKDFPSDAELHGKGAHESGTENYVNSSDVILESITKGHAVFSYGNKMQKPAELKLDGLYNILNSASALALVRMITENSSDRLLMELKNVKPAFGRGEAIQIDGDSLEIVLVKNPSGFRLAIRSYAKLPASTMIAINDNYADGRDMSWLWDVDFSSLAEKVEMVSGIRAYDMATRLQYDNVEVAHVETNLTTALNLFLKNTEGRRRIYCTYTAMLALRRELAKKYSVEPIE